MKSFLGVKALRHSSWRWAANSGGTSAFGLIHNFRGLLGAAEEGLGADRIRQHHDELMLRVRRLIERGQAEARFRSDQPAEWLVACFFAILHGAETEIREGRLNEAAAEKVIPQTIQALVSIPNATEFPYFLTPCGAPAKVRSCPRLHMQPSLRIGVDRCQG
ncbi:hypothetical protein M8J71_02535 [Pseudarthrobacter sp. R1]|nr:hypothetical protein [Pseudarthrobacter sp. R1]